MWSHIQNFFTQAADAVVAPSYPWSATPDCPLVFTVNVHGDMSEFPIVLEGDNIWIDLGDGKGYRAVCTETEKHTNAQHEYICKYDPYKLLTKDQIEEWETVEDEGDGWSCGWYPTGHRVYDIKITGELRTIEFDRKLLPTECNAENPTALLAMRWVRLPYLPDTKEA